MNKIITLFERNHDGDRLVRNEVTPGAEWVIEGEGVATRKWDGTCCMVRDGKLYKRHTVQRGQTPPPEFESAGEIDEMSGRTVGWIPVGDGPEDRWHRQAFFGDEADGTYELVGPKVQGNPEQFESHSLLLHGLILLLGSPRTYSELREYLGKRDIEGIVWHHPDGRMVKLKGRDFGLKRITVKEDAQ